jgi:hypothetical protein
MPLFNKRTNVKTVTQLLKTASGRDQYGRELRAIQRIVPDMTESQARELIASRRRKNEIIDFKASAVEKSRFRDEFGKRSASSNLGQLTKIVNKRKEQNEQRRGDTETQVSTEGKTFRGIARKTENHTTESQRRKLRKLEADYWKEYKRAMGYAA